MGAQAGAGEGRRRPRRGGCWAQERGAREGHRGAQKRGGPRGAGGWHVLAGREPGPDKLGSRPLARAYHGQTDGQPANPATPPQPRSAA